LAIKREIKIINHVKKSTSQGRGGRGRRVKISTKHMNKNKRKSYKEYRGQGR
jgi:NADH:ubiquinone oxidoreductase subunit F (NADH-binding)|tara:strand:+ start:1413 stop:1568 length:156 start_codon:yes stop_codon:yes gene_type:complete